MLQTQINYKNGPNARVLSSRLIIRSLSVFFSKNSPDSNSSVIALRFSPHVPHQLHEALNTFWDERASVASCARCYQPWHQLIKEAAVPKQHETKYRLGTRKLKKPAHYKIIHFKNTEATNCLGVTCFCASKFSVFLTVLSAICISVGRQIPTLTLATCTITSSIMICNSHKIQVSAKFVKHTLASRVYSDFSR